MEKSSVNTAALALLKKYRAGQCTAEEVERVERWFSSFEDNEAELTTADMAAIEAARRHILTQTTTKHNAPVVKLKTAYKWYAAAACIIISFSIGAVLLINRKTINTESAENNIVITAKGERKKLTLSDGSVVMLNAASTFKLLSFSKENRTVSLSGEAFFYIAKDHQHPFIIKTGKIQTHVVGTSFDVRAYAGEPNIEVAVSTGRVKIEENKAGGRMLGSVMTVNHLFTYNTQNGSYTITENDVRNASGWMNNRLYFDKATIGDMIRELQRTYNTTIVLEGNSSSNPHFTAQFNVIGLDQTLDQLSILTGLTYRHTANQVIVNITHVR